MALPIILLLFLLLLKSPAPSSQMEIHQTPPPPSSGDQPTSRIALLREIQESKLKLAQLETDLERSIQELNERSVRIKACEKKIEELDLLTNSLRSSLASLEADHSHVNEKVSNLEAELTLLWSTSRKKYFEIHTLECRLRDAEKRLNGTKAQVNEVTEIISEQWIQIQQLEQAVHMAEFRTMKVKRQLRAARCPFVRFIKNVVGDHFAMLNWILDPYLYDGFATLESSISEAPICLRKTFSAVKHYHHQLQGYIKQYMLRNKVTAVLVHKEVAEEGTILRMRVETHFPDTDTNNDSNTSSYL
ncbi:OLC1v1021454C1 [Oldenlandia corymbosa var. corymbosa]|uniref:OLC1v1021454C1 n=1 Tax=Oldenlandia corymbosa var. corymbosa TaxID=529605 RepID=A0AAV1BWB4_OLDCO|nr:OLC1v1021454C1 [Oldenlandia corymbosa var. corymbosa]